MTFIRELADVKVTKLPTSVTFECEVNKPHMPAQWFKGNEPIKRSEKYTVEAIGNVHKLIIKDVEGKDECDYSVHIKSSRSTANLSIACPPVITTEKYSETIQLREGDSVALEVPFKANPQPKVSWKYNGQDVVTSRRLAMDVIYNMTSVCLASVKTEDSGRYSLILNNEHGKVTLDINVKVTGRPSVPENLTFSKVTENSVTLTWDEPKTDGGSRIKQYVIEKRDTRRHGYTHVGSTRSREFKVGRLVEGQEHTFQVSAENDVGVGRAAELTQGVTAKSPYSK